MTYKNRHVQSHIEIVLFNDRAMQVVRSGVVDDDRDHRGRRITHTGQRDPLSSTTGLPVISPLWHAAATAHRKRRRENHNLREPVGAVIVLVTIPIRIEILLRVFQHKPRKSNPLHGFGMGPVSYTWLEVGFSQLVSSIATSYAYSVRISDTGTTVY